MSKKNYTAEQIINKLREAEVMAASGETVESAVRRLGVTKNTFYRWRKEYGGMRVDQARRLKDLEVENGRLKRLVADLSLDNSILREAVSGNF
jgi:putative transposase